jgi:hypothetical protein
LGLKDNKRGVKMKLFCCHKYKAVEQVPYGLGGENHILTFLECKECGEKKCVYTSFSLPSSIKDIVFRWVKGEYDLKTTMIILGQDVL